MTDKLEEAGIVVMDYDSRWGRFRMSLKPGEIEKNKELLTEIINEAYEFASKD